MTILAKIAVRLWILPLLLAGAACTAHTLSTLKSESDQLQTTLGICQGDNKANADSALCLTSLDAPLLDLARKARDAAPQAADERTRIGFLATSALSGWSSLTPEGAQLADDVAADGRNRCGQADPKSTFVPLRDCNLLELEPGFARHSLAIIFLTEIERMPTPLDPGIVASLNDQASSYIANTWDFLESKRAELEARHFLHPVVAEYLDKQRTIIFCTAARFAVWESKVEGPLLPTLRADIKSKMTDPPHSKKVQDCNPNMFAPN
jgi:hypothetical protein